jgi:hypothetical protein
LWGIILVTNYCANCGRLSGFKRSLGWGTFFMVVLTCGLWLLVLPLYPKRCIHCGITQGKAFRMELVPALRRAGSDQVAEGQISGWVVGGFIGGLLLLLLFLSTR